MSQVQWTVLCATFVSITGATDLLWDNGQWDESGGMASERDTRIADAWTIDDIVVERAVVIRIIQWTCLIGENDLFLPVGADVIVLDDALTTRYEKRDLPYTRRFERKIFSLLVYRMTLPHLAIALQPGHYYIGARPVGNGYGRAFTGINTTIHGKTEGYFRSEALGVPDWTLISRFTGDPRDVAFSISGLYITLGDLNCDGAVDFGDVNPFVLALSDPDEYDRQYPDCNLYNGDCNKDQKVDFGDINPFVELLTGG